MNTNTWNRLRYSLYAPIYDRIVRPFSASRKRSVELLELQAGENTLIVGAGTGEDLQFIPEQVDITAVDITPAMIEQVRSKAKQLQRPVQASVMDGQALDLPSEHFDAVVLHLILAVIPDPFACMQESVRVLKPGGRVIVFDKFLQADEQPSWPRLVANLAAGFIFSDINRKLEPIVATVPVKLLHEEPAALGRFGYKIALYQKV